MMVVHVMKKKNQMTFKIICQLKNYILPQIQKFPPFSARLARNQKVSKIIILLSSEEALEYPVKNHKILIFKNYLELKKGN